MSQLLKNINEDSQRYRRDKLKELEDAVSEVLSRRIRLVGLAPWLCPPSLNHRLCTYSHLCFFLLLVICGLPTAEEWCNTDDEHSTAISDGTCRGEFDCDGRRTSVKGCNKPYHYRQRGKMASYAHDDFLPDDKIRAASIMFELRIPSYIAAYRNAT